MVEIATINSKICNKDRVWSNLISEFMCRPAGIKISMMGEGPCLNHIGLYTMLDELCALYNRCPNEIEISTSNLLETHDKYKICLTPQINELKAVQQSMFSVQSAKQFDEKFKHFGSFIGHANQYRLETAAFLWHHHRHQTLQSWHCEITDPYHREHFGLEDMLFAGQSADDSRDALDLLLHGPIYLDSIQRYPILIPENLNIMKYYDRFFVEIVNLTYFSGTVFYVDEKVWRPMAMCTPFIIQGPRNTIVNLRKLGFETFHQWWDEGYSEDPENCQMSAIKAIVDRLSQLSVAEIEHLYQDMQPVLKHNQKRMMSLTYTEILECFG